MVMVSFVSPEAEQARRRSFSIKDKRDFVHRIDSIVSTGVSHCQACVRVGLPYLYYVRFKKVIHKVDALENRDVTFPSRQMVLHARFIPANPVCYVQSKMI